MQTEKRRFFSWHFVTCREKLSSCRRGITHPPLARWCSRWNIGGHWIKRQREQAHTRHKHHLYISITDWILVQGNLCQWVWSSSFSCRWIRFAGWNWQHIRHPLTYSATSCCMPVCHLLECFIGGLDTIVSCAWCILCVCQHHPPFGREVLWALAQWVAQGHMWEHRLEDAACAW